MYNSNPLFKHMRDMCVIYKLTSPSGKSYIGQSVNFESRYNKYKNNSTGSIGKYISNAISKHGGIEKFTIEFLFISPRTDDIKKDKNMLDQLELQYIKKFDTRVNGYNLTNGGKGSFKRLVSEETRKKLSESLKLAKPVELLEFSCINCSSKMYLSAYTATFRARRNKYGLFCSTSCGAKFRQKLNTEGKSRDAD